MTSARKQIVDRYFDGFRRGDHEQILALLHDDITWDLPGHASFHGKAEFDSEIENPDFEGRPVLIVDRVVEEVDTIVAIGNGRGRFVGGAAFEFAFCTVFTFTAGDLIGRVESYIVPLASS